MSKLRRVSVAVASAALIFTFAARTEAMMIVPGGSAGVDTVVCAGCNPFANTLVESVGPLMDSSASGFLDATFWAAVYRDNVTGFLDFYYQVRNDASSNNGIFATRETDLSFAGFTTDMYTTIGGFGIFAAGGQNATTMDRSALPGSTVGFNFEAGGNGTVDPGEMSYVKIVRTNATHYGVGFTQLINGGVAEVTTFAPQVVPEPASLLLFGTGLIGCVVAARRRMKR